MRWHGVIKPRSVYSHPVITFDISATALTVPASADYSEIDGVDLLPYLAGKKSGFPHEALFWRSRTMSNNYAAQRPMEVRAFDRRIGRPRPETNTSA